MKLDNPLKISFDFDSTLSEPCMQELAKKYLIHGAHVFVVTSRGTKNAMGFINNTDLYDVTDSLGIDRNNVIFTEYEDKYTFVKDMDIHYDDDFEEIFLINQNPSKCIGFLFEEKPKKHIQYF